MNQPELTVEDYIQHLNDFCDERGYPEIMREIVVSEAIKQFRNNPDVFRHQIVNYDEYFNEELNDD